MVDDSECIEEGQSSVAVDRLNSFPGIRDSYVLPAIRSLFCNVRCSYNAFRLHRQLVVLRLSMALPTFTAEVKGALQSSVTENLIHDLFTECSYSVNNPGV
jgi:hypothetical protein